MEPIKLNFAEDKSGRPAIMFIDREPSGEEIEQLIYHLGVRRSGTPPPVPQSGPLETKRAVALIEDPVTTVHPEYTGSTLLAFRHPAFGWIHFRMSRDYLKGTFGTLLKGIQKTDAEDAGRPNP